MTKTEQDIRKGIVMALLAVGGAIMLFPFAWMIATSFKAGAEVYSLSLLPKHPTIENYKRLIEMGSFPRWFFNSIYIGGLVTLSSLFFDSLAGYTFAKFKFKGKEFFFILILATMMIPKEMLVIPWYIMSDNLGWVDSYWGILFPGMITGFGTFLMRQFFYSVPDDLIESGRIDGLHEFKIWWLIAMPLVRPALAALAIFAFIGNWNAFLWPLIVTSSSELFTLPVGLAFFSGEFQTEWEMVMTGATVASVPAFIIFLVFQRQIIRGIALTGLKG